MRTSLNELKLIEDFLEGKINEGEQLLFTAHGLIDAEWALKIKQQQKVYKLIQVFGRQELQRMIREVEQQFFTVPEYSELLTQIGRFFQP